MTLEDKGLIEYLGKNQFSGTVRHRLKNAMLRVELDGTGDQDSEGHNMGTDVRADQVKLLSS